METGKLEFQPLNRETLDACATIARHAPDPWRHSALAFALFDAFHQTFVAVLEEKPVAFACFLTTEDSCDLEMLVVHPDARGQGIAEKLLRHALAKLAADGIRQCLLEVRAGNLGAISVYERLGFKTLAPRKNMFSNPVEDGLLMARTL